LLPNLFVLFYFKFCIWTCGWFDFNSFICIIPIYRVLMFVGTRFYRFWWFLPYHVFLSAINCVECRIAVIVINYYSIVWVHIRQGPDRFPGFYLYNFLCISILVFRLWDIGNYSGEFYITIIVDSTFANNIEIFWQNRICTDSRAALQLFVLFVSSFERILLLV